jgi:hypothetical protein
VRDGIGEEVRALLLDQRRLLAFRLRLLVGLARLFLLLDEALDGALADAHPEMVHGGLLGQREHIDALDEFGARVLEHLRHARSGDDAGHLDRDLGFHRGRDDVLAGVAGSQQELPRLCIVQRRRLRRRREQERHHR